jgi:tellurite resistance protein TerC
MTGILVLVGFLLLVLGIVMLDLGVFHRHARIVRMREALAWTSVWITLAMLFSVFVYYLYEHSLFDWDKQTLVNVPALYKDAKSVGRTALVDFVTGYLVELSLSLDNVFVIALILAYFRVPLAQQHRVLFWGIMGAIVLRGVMIGAGAALIARFEWVIYVFGALLLISAARMLVVRHDALEPERNLFVRLTRLMFPVTTQFHGEHFFTRVDGKLTATPLFLALMLVESSDVMFAVDSIPAIFAVTRDPFLVFTSNIFAILGLRSMYFLLAGLMDRFRYLKISLVFLLAYIGVKMLVSHHFPIPNSISLAFIAGILSVGVLASLVAPRREPPRLHSPLEDFDTAAGAQDAEEGVTEF